MTVIEPTDLLNPYKAVREDKNTAEKLNDFLHQFLLKNFLKITMKPAVS